MALKAPRKPVTGTARLLLCVTVPGKRKPNTTVYTVSRLSPHPQVGHPAYRLTKEDGTTYDVIRTAHGWVCCCPDFTYCRGNHEKGCKHTAAVAGLVQQGLLNTLLPE